MSASMWPTARRFFIYLICQDPLVYFTHKPGRPLCFDTSSSLARPLRVRATERKVVNGDICTVDAACLLAALHLECGSKRCTLVITFWTFSLNLTCYRFFPKRQALPIFCKCYVNFQLMRQIYVGIHMQNRNKIQTIANPGNLYPNRLNKLFPNRQNSS